MSSKHRKRRKLVFGVLATLGCVPVLPNTLAAQNSTIATNSIVNPQGVAIGTGSPVGVYFAVGNAICRLVQRDAPADGESLRPSLGCAATATGGSAPNLEAMRTGGIEFAIVQSDAMFNAARGLDRFNGRKMEKLRALFSLHVEPFQLLVARGLGISSISDLKGRKVNIGPPGSTQSAIMNELFGLHKLETRSFAQLTQLPPAEQFQAFCAGDIEAIGMLIGSPNAAYASAIKNCGGELVDVNSEPVRGLLASAPYYATVSIPQSAYPAMDKATATFGVLAIAATTTDVPAETVYRLVRAVFERLDDLKAMHPALNALEPSRMINDGMTVPLHPGAEQYYRERGWLGSGGPR